MTIEAIKVNVTFQTVTPESAEYGDYADSGFITENMEFDDFADMVSYVESNGYSLSNASMYPLTGATMHENVWFSTDPEIEDYRTMEEITYSIHPCNDRTARYLFKALHVTGQ